MSNHAGNCPYGIFAGVVGPEIFGCTCGAVDYQPKARKGTYFGLKTSRPEDDDAPMQTDCGGAMITQCSMTQGRAREIVADTDLKELHEFILAYPKEGYSFKDWNSDSYVFWGTVMVVIYRYLNARIPWERKYPDPENKAYDNSAEFLYRLLLDKMEEAGLIAKVKEQLTEEVEALLASYEDKARADAVRQLVIDSGRYYNLRP
jgi:hypothetical protein